MAPTTGQGNPGHPRCQGQRHWCGVCLVPSMPGSPRAGQLRGKGRMLTLQPVPQFWLNTHSVGYDAPFSAGCPAPAAFQDVAQPGGHTWGLHASIHHYTIWPASCMSPTGQELPCPDQPRATPLLQAPCTPFSWSCGNQSRKAEPTGKRVLANLSALGSPSRLLCRPLAGSLVPAAGVREARPYCTLSPWQWQCHCFPAQALPCPDAWGAPVPLQAPHP